MRTEDVIFANLLYNEKFTRKVFPYLKSEYFKEDSDKAFFYEYQNYFEKYNRLPTKESMVIELTNSDEVSEDVFTHTIETINDLEKPDNESFEWLIDTSEKFCQERAIENAIMQSISIIDGDEKKISKNAIPNLLSDALAVSFNSHIGHDYLDDAESRYDFYTKKENKYPFLLTNFNKITKGGLIPKSLNLVVAGTGVGKTIVLCNFAADYLLQGYNVLYLTMEMQEEKISERIDANLLNVAIDDLSKIGKEKFLSKVSKLKQKTKGKLITHEFPTGGAHAGHFRTLLNELSMKKKFKPDILIVDYLGICSSMRFPQGNTGGKYFPLQSIAEELRGLGQEFNIPVLSAHQLNREGNDNSDVTLKEIAESFGITHACDFIFALMQPEELVAREQMIVKQLKNRYNDVNYIKKFVIGIDKTKMRMYNVESDINEKYVADEKETVSKGNTKTGKTRFSGIKV